MGLQHVDTLYQKEQIYAETWGHLAPKKNITYKGKILFSKSYFYSRNNSIIDFEFNKLESSPWLFARLERFIQDSELEKGFAYKANITFRNYRIWIKVTNKIKL